MMTGSGGNGVVDTTGVVDFSVLPKIHINKDVVDTKGVVVFSVLLKIYIKF